MLKIIFAGSPEAAKKTLEILVSKQIEYNFQITGVISNPPSAKGRHKELTPTPVASLAMEKSIPVFTPEHLDSSARETIAPLNADLLISFAYGHIFGPKFLALFPMGGLNLHPSLLPKYRGCTPVPAAILNRDEKTAVTIQSLALKMDEGDILAQQIIELNGTETAESLLNQSAVIGTDLLLSIITKINQQNKMVTGIKQAGEPSYTGILTKDDGKIDWNNSAISIEAKIRAFFPDPGCWTLENNVPLKLLSANYIENKDSRAIKYLNEPIGKVVEYNKTDGIYVKTGDGLLCVTKLQRQGKNPMGYKDFMNGARTFVGTILQ